MSVSNIVSNLLISFKVTSISAEDRTCNVTVSFDYGDDVHSGNLRGVSMSRLLSWRFENASDKYGLEVGRTYTSSIDSSDRLENPFKLIRYGTKDDVKFALYPVEERQPLRLVRYDAFGNEMVEYVNRFHSKDYYRRYVDSIKQ